MTIHKDTNPASDIAAAAVGAPASEPIVSSLLTTYGGRAAPVAAPAGSFGGGTLSLDTCDAWASETNPEGLK